MKRQAQTNQESQPNITKPPHNRCGRGTGVFGGVWRDEEEEDDWVTLKDVYTYALRARSRLE
jgi:hypothetical protein